MAENGSGNHCRRNNTLNRTEHKMAVEGNMEEEVKV